MIRGLISFVVSAIAVIAQVTIVNRIAFPGGTGPNLVLLAVAALALANGPLTGALIGFWAGLALDVAPPGSYLVGENALVFCLIGYACGLAAEPPRREGVPEHQRTALFEILVTAVGAVCGEVLTAALGKMVSDPHISVPAARHVLPFAVAYDVVLSPFVLFAVAAALRLAPGRARDSAEPFGARAARAARAAGATPGLRLGDRSKGEEALRRSLRGGQGTGGSSSQPLAKREPRLKLGRGGSLGAGVLSTGGLSTGSLGAAFATGGTRRGTGLGGPAPAKVKFSSRRGEAMLGGAMAMNSAVARSRLNSSRFGRTRLGRSLFGGSVFSRSPSALRASGSVASLTRPAPIGRSAFGGQSQFLGRTSLFGRSSSLGRSPKLGRSLRSGRSAAGLRSAPGGSAAGYVPRAARRGILARLGSALRGSGRSQQSAFRGSAFRGSAIRSPAIRGKTPGRGWLRGSSGRGLSAGRSPQLGTGRSGPARLHMGRAKGPKTNKRWRTGGYR
jgi:rod shape-determining protein MreD